MGREFRLLDSSFGKFFPKGWQAACTWPSKVDEGLFGRMELCIGRLGTGKTTWGSLRARRLANATGRALYTTGQGWPEPWRPIASLADLSRIRDAVVVLDEIHLLMPSSKGLLGPEVERALIVWLSLCRKRRVDVVGTTQAWTRVATHYRQLVTTVWVCRAEQRGRLHRAFPCDRPDEGGEQFLPTQWFNPRHALIPTNASVWLPYAVLDAEGEPV